MCPSIFEDGTIISAFELHQFFIVLWVLKVVKQLFYCRVLRRNEWSRRFGYWRLVSIRIIRLLRLQGYLCSLLLLMAGESVISNSPLNTSWLCSLLSSLDRCIRFLRGKYYHFILLLPWSFLLFLPSSSTSSTHAVTLESRKRPCLPMGLFLACDKRSSLWDYFLWHRHAFSWGWLRVSSGRPHTTLYKPTATNRGGGK